MCVLVFVSASVLCFSLVLHPGGTKRIDKAHLSLSTMDDEGTEKWEKFFEKAENKLGKNEACNNLNFKTASDDDISTCVQFTLFTRENTKGTQLEGNDPATLRESGFVSGNPTIIIIHGYLHRENVDDPWMGNMKDAFLKLDDVNVLLVEWSSFSNQIYYPRVVQNASKLATLISKLMSLMINEGSDLKTLHIIGHSLGAHVGGLASQNLTEGIVGRITGLDPAGPLFLQGGDSTRLDRSDADFVDCIHTNYGFLGIGTPVCSADFFVNGGRLQPGCCEWVNVGRCGHLRSTEFFLETISKDVKIEAYSCATIPDMEPVTCIHNGAVMGLPANSSHRGIFYVETGMEKPYHKIPSKEKLAEAEERCFSLFPLTWILG